MFLSSCNTDAFDDSRHSSLWNTDSFELRDPEGYVYAAFISYRHLPRDTCVAKQVQKAIETYRLPYSLRAGEHNCRGGKLGKCFRDEDELAASHSLPKSITDALTCSRKLIVICTPQTRESTWVNREIEEFIRIHGSEHVICVLASGSASESIPDILASRKDAVSCDDAVFKWGGNPLAADLRSRSRKKSASEILRIIAAVANCDYDALKCRQRTRRNRQIAISVASICTLFCVIAALVFWGLSSIQKHQIAESKLLASEAIELYDQGEHIEAIKTALKALPASESDTSRPLVHEAQEALDTVLGLNPDPSRPWVPLFSFDSDSNVVQVVASGEGDWAAVLDDTGLITTYSLTTGLSLATIQFEGFCDYDDKNPISDWFIEELSPSCLLAANSTGSGGVCCFNPMTGKVLWGYRHMYALSVSTVEGSNNIVLFAYESSADFVAYLMNCETGRLISSVSLSLSEPLQYVNRDLLRVRVNGSCGYSVVENTLVKFDFTKKKSSQFEIGNMPIASIVENNNIAVIATAGSVNHAVNEGDLPFTISAYDMSGETPLLLWTIEDTYHATASTTNGFAEVFLGNLRLFDVVQGDHDIALVIAGNKIGAINIDTGDMVYSHEFDTSIIEAATCFVQNERYAITFASFDGKLDIVSPSLWITTFVDTSTIEIPANIDGAILIESLYGNPLALIRKVGIPNRVFCYYFRPFYNESDIRNYSLNELLGFAHQALEGR